MDSQLKSITKISKLTINSSKIVSFVIFIDTSWNFQQLHYSIQKTMNYLKSRCLIAVYCTNSPFISCSNLCNIKCIKLIKVPFLIKYIKK